MTTADSPSTSLSSRTVPIPDTLSAIPGYPPKLKIYKIAASPFWQVRCYENGRTIKLSTGSEDKREAIKFAKATYDRILLERAGGIAISKGTRFDICAKKMLEIQASRVTRKEFSEMAHANDLYLLNRRILPAFRDKDVTAISQDDLLDFIAKIEDLAPSSIQRHLGIIRKVLDYAIDRNLLKALPKFPRIEKRDEPRGWFTEHQFKELLNRATALVGSEHVIRATPKAGQEQGNTVRRLKFTVDLPKMIDFMVNSFIRPSDLKNMQHKHVAVIRGERTFLRLTLPESKAHDHPIVTMEQAVVAYEALKETHAASDLAGPDDYVFMPEFLNRNTALRRLEQQFNFLLEDLALKTGPRGEARTIYSLRHTCIMHRLLHSEGMDMATLAKNSRTSIEMIERFYASGLTGEMNIDMIQSDRRKRKPATASPSLDLHAPEEGAPRIKLVGGLLQIEKPPGDKQGK